MLLFAHGIVGRADLPIPETLFGAAAAAVLVVSFVALALGWSRPRLKSLPEKDLFVFPVALEVLLGALGVIVFLFTVYAGIAGTSGQTDNLAPTMVYVAFWVGVPFASLLLGNVFGVISPWRALGRATGWIGERFTEGAMPAPLVYPERLGRLPAAAGLFGFAICELCWAKATEPGPLAIIMLLYFIAMLVGMSLYGVDAWTRNADAFGVLFGLIGSLSPLGRRAENGRLYLRVPFTGAAKLTPVNGTMAVLIVSVGSTAFDGAKEGALFNNLAQDLQSFFVDLGLSLGLGLELGFVVGLAGAVLIVAIIWALGMAGMKPPPSVPSRRELARAFAHTLIPIAAGYLFAHYFSLLAYNGQDLWRLANDPLGNGADYFGGADATINYGVVSATGIWYVQVAALVIGHVAALVLAHDRALELYGSAKDATRSQLVMLALMVAFTCLGLWLLSAALHG
ncbi:fenitrothion hydrolase [Solirubrobacter ginsenosidimutans]|uniref:Fenitrothion hydrolase n=1 Tax=Solirubrobacter ginsenosidimutans TaxID=490573 RepID=A0A9X3N1V3_9ACTN|nr:fenitrothion hydrolase [Solirubrobacter ginsenosidimutans]MDA0165157.1 fenitrothion hydrolase [Solirubrobacter ginsenosidimutans]